MTFALGWEGYLGAKEALNTIDKVGRENRSASSFVIRFTYFSAEFSQIPHFRRPYAFFGCRRGSGRWQGCRKTRSRPFSTVSRL